PLMRGEHAVAVVAMKQLHEELAVLLPLLDGVAEQALDLPAREDVRADRVEGVDVDDEGKLLDKRAISPVDLSPLGRVDHRLLDGKLSLEHNARDAGRHLDQL